MNCNNKHCMWNFKGTCVSESLDEVKDESFKPFTPNKIDCPKSLRKDLETEMWHMVGWLEEVIGIDKTLLYKLKFRELANICLPLERVCLRLKNIKRRDRFE